MENGDYDCLWSFVPGSRPWVLIPQPSPGDAVVAATLM